MAVVYKGVGRRNVEEIVARHVEVQTDLENRAWAIALRAEAELLAHKQDGDAYIDLVHGDIDYYVVLDDSRGLDAALSIEFGRAGFIDPDTGEVYGAMEPLHILTNAAGVRTKGKRLPIQSRRRKLRKRGVLNGGDTR